MVIKSSPIYRFRCRLEVIGCNEVGKGVLGADTGKEDESTTPKEITHLYTYLSGPKIIFL